MNVVSQPPNHSLQTDRRSRHHGHQLALAVVVDMAPTGAPELFLPPKCTAFGDHRALWWRRPLSSNILRLVLADEIVRWRMKS